MNTVIHNLTIRNYLAFKDSFEGAKEIFWDEAESKLVHPGEYGAYREELAKTWLRMYVPQQFGIGSGFVISSDNSVSTQCDIVIFDALRTPKIESIESQRFYPVETVSCVGEIKSDINSIAQLNEYLTKLSALKRMRETVAYPDPYYRGCESPFSPQENPFDNIFTFLICKRFNFEFNPEGIDYGGVEQRFKHNLVLSLDDGLLMYVKEPGGKVRLPFPFKREVNHHDYFLSIDENELPNSIVTFLSSLQVALNLNALLSIDMTRYLSDDYVEAI